MREEVVLLASLSAEALLHERTGLSAGGILAPALIALHLGEARFLLEFSILTAFAYLSAGLISLLVPLYGRRALYASVLAGALARVLAAQVLQAPGYHGLLLSVAPGILAHQMRVQGVLLTLSATASATAFAYCAGVLL